jgi:predicted ATPase
MAPRALRERFYRERFLDIQQQLRSMINLCWLSVHRSNEDQRPNEERKYVSAVDQKLTSLKTAFLKYFSQLSRNYSEQTKDFQKKSFLSLLTAEGETSVIDFSKKLDIESEKNSLEKVFGVLGVASSEYNNRLETHFKRFSTSLKKHLETNELNTVQFAAFYNAWKAHSLVQYYETLEKNRQEIFRPQDNFIKVINELFDGRKTASISERNEIIVKSRDGRQIPLEDLSSGEKQLLIILGEALLQEGETIVYIADEPELSLHVKWQERLTNSISKLNPNAQIVFATHSPDIVSDKADKIINMELLLG